MCELSSSAASAQAPLGVAEASAWWIPGASRIDGLASGDFDADGDLDVVVTTSGVSALFRCVCDGSGQFAAPQTLARDECPRNVALADFNGDGALDVVTANGRARSRSASVLPGNGAEGFGAPSQLDAGARAWSVASADVNGDSQTDFVLGLRGAAAVGVRLGRGDGTFAEQTNFTRGGGKPMDAQPLDADGDGLLEFLVGEGIPNLSVLRALPGVQASGDCFSGRFTVHPCTPRTSATGAPSVSAPNGFRISVSGLPPSTSSLLLCGVSGRQRTPWATTPATASGLCVRQPAQRTPIATTLSISGCDRRSALDFNSYRALHPSALDQPLQLDQLVQSQAWLRDTGASGTLLSAAVEFVLGP